MEIIKLKDLQDYKTQNIKMFLYGASFSGKTRFATTFPKPFIISTDGNIKGLDEVNEDAMAVILDDYTERTTTSGVKLKESGWVTFKSLIDGLIKEDDVETIVVDIVKDVYDMCRKYVLDLEGAKHESEIKQRGKIWTLLDSEFLPVLRKLMTSKKNVILITHEKDREGTIGPSTIDSLTQKIQSYVDINGRLMTAGLPGEEPRRILHVAPAIRQAGGNRLGLKKPIDSPDYNKLIDALKTKKEI